jgi:hypothetical protein
MARDIDAQFEPASTGQITTRGRHLQKSKSSLFAGKRLLMEADNEL